MSAMLNGIRMFLWRQEASRIGIKLNLNKDYVQRRGQRGRFSGSKATVTSALKHRLFIEIVTVDGRQISVKVKRRTSERRCQRFVAQYNTYSGAHRME